MKKIILCLVLLASFYNVLITDHEINTDYLKMIQDKLDRELRFTSRFNHILKYTKGMLTYDQLDFLEKKMGEYGLDLPVEFMVALIETESHFIHDRKSSSGAYGYCQIMKNTEKFINMDYNLSLDRKNSFDNMELSIIYIRDLMNSLGSLEKAVRFYNGGTRWEEIPSTKVYYNVIMRRYLKLMGVDDSTMLKVFS